MSSEFSISVRVYYEDTDAGGVVYYANYLKFMERARTEWLRSLGLEQDDLIKDPGIVFAVRSAQLNFLKPARFNDALTVKSVVEHIGKASMVFKQWIMHNDDRICEGKIKIACLDADTFSPSPLPDDIEQKLKTL